MSKRSDLVYFGTLLDAARAARDLAPNLTKEEFDADRTMQLALTYLLQNVGEAASKVPGHLRVLHPEVDWPGMIGMRHRIVHDYVNVNTERVWLALHDDIPRLIAQLLEFTPPEPPSA
jgi:uncharacterized protein with HEPN domain